VVKDFLTPDAPEWFGSSNFNGMGQISCRSIMWFDIRVALFLLLFVAPSCSLRWETSKIWPAPQTEIYDTSNPVLRTLNTSNFHFEFDDNTNISNDVQSLIKTAQTRFFDSLRKLVPPDPISNPPDDPNAVYDDIPGVRFQIASDTTKLAYGIDESYIIHIGYAFNTTTSYIHVECITVYGALHALQSLLQIVEFGWIERDENNQDNPIFLISHTPMYIQDAPEYGYRGLMIDTSRHYLDVDLIITNLHVMAAHKLNVMHWHLVDSQSWPYASSQFPELAEKAAYCRHCTYNSTQIKNILQAAASLGIRVIVEIDLPGHSQGTFSFCGDFRLFAGTHSYFTQTLIMSLFYSYWEFTPRVSYLVFWNAFRTVGCDKQRGSRFCKDVVHRSHSSIPRYLDTCGWRRS
jgi:hexosaminidase